MTYNFDPEAWWQRHAELLRRRHRAGELGDAELAAALAELDRRLEAMLARLDGTYQLPPSHEAGGAGPGDGAANPGTRYARTEE